MMMHWSRYSREREIGFLMILWNMLIKFRDSHRKQKRNRKSGLLPLQSDLGKKKSSLTPDMVFHLSLSSTAYLGLVFAMSVHSHRIQNFFISQCLSKLIRNLEVMESEIIDVTCISRSVLCNSEKRMLLYLEILKWWIRQKVRISL